VSWRPFLRRKWMNREQQTGTRGATHAFRPYNFRRRCPELIRYRGLPFAVLPPFIKVGFHFFEADSRCFASRHRLPQNREPRRKNDLSNYARQFSCIVAGNSLYF
jgi:hypothetical protein